MQQISCPQCGAPVRFTSTASVMAVCGACRSTLVKDADHVSRIGTMAELVEDYSPVQIGTAGHHDGKRFEVVGRIQLRYPEGVWSEWYLWFDDGTDGWLADASGQYTLTRRRERSPDLQAFPRFGSIVPGGSLLLDGQEFIAADKRTCNSVGGEGELPMVAAGKWQARVADYRRLDQFLTLDYSDGDPPALYVGQAVSLDIMQAASLREPDRFDDSVVRYRGEIKAMACPACGAPVSFAVAVATQVICPSCRSTFDCSANTIKAVAKHKKVAEFVTTLRLGEEALIDGNNYSLIGLLKCADPDPDESSDWIEYLLYHRTAGFLWLVESEEGWDRVKVCDAWPSRESDTRYRLGNTSYTHLYDYESKVMVALGAFNWRVKRGDTTAISDFGHRKGKLTRERTADELGWSVSTPVSGKMLAEWFKRPELERRVARRKPLNSLSTTAVWATLALLFFNLNMVFEGGALTVIAGVIGLWVPPLIVHFFNQSVVDS